MSDKTINNIGYRGPTSETVYKKYGEYKVKTNKIIKILSVVLALFIMSGQLVAQTASLIATPAGSVIFSTNTAISYENAVGTTFTTNGESTNNQVLAIYGFTNQVTILGGSTVGVSAGQK